MILYFLCSYKSASYIQLYMYRVINVCHSDKKKCCYLFRLLILGFFNRVVRIKKVVKTKEEKEKEKEEKKKEKEKEGEKGDVKEKDESESKKPKKKPKKEKTEEGKKAS